MSAAPRIDASIVAQAADWIVKLQAGASPRDHAACQRWRARSPLHEEAWRRMTSLTQSLDENVARIGPQATRSVLDSVTGAQQKRRRTLTRLLGLSATGVMGWGLMERLPWRGWSAGYRTATGERREFILADGTRLMLNTGSAADVRFDDRQRRIALYEGEILVITGRDPAGRPLHVATRNGVITPVGTRFTVRQPAENEGDTQVSVIEGAVEIRPDDASGRVLTLARGQSTSFGRVDIAPPVTLEPGNVAWIDGLLVARNMRLGDFIAELSRYRRGILRCDTSASDLRVTGSFPVQDTDKVLRLLQQVLPVGIQTRSSYWVTLTRRTS
ncbi:transmembrane sensor [Paraburkholderia sp. GAS199]|uniref:FecR domain-containing protein n=1 Tax=Paraburkholderia sp. GAS199 TaxID=3035126 RepID=UPI003D2013F7